MFLWSIYSTFFTPLVRLLPGPPEAPAGPRVRAARLPRRRRRPLLPRLQGRPHLPDGLRQAEDRAAVRPVALAGLDTIVPFRKISKRPL